jgi:hypothetical protein
MDEIESIILNYESDTFSGAELTLADADRMAALLFDRLCKVVRTGGTLRCDGEVLAGLFEEVRG